MCSRRFPQRRPWRLTGRSCGSPALQLGADAETIHAYAGRQQTVSDHLAPHRRAPAPGCVRCRRACERLARFLEDEALRLEPRTTPGTAPLPDHTRPASGRSSIAAAKKLQKSLDGHYSVTHGLEDGSRLVAPEPGVEHGHADEAEPRRQLVELTLQCAGAARRQQDVAESPALGVERPLSRRPDCRRTPSNRPAFRQPGNRPLRPR